MRRLSPSGCWSSSSLGACGFCGGGGGRTHELWRRVGYPVTTAKDLLSDLRGIVGPGVLTRVLLKVRENDLLGLAGQLTYFFLLCSFDSHHQGGQPGLRPGGDAVLLETTRHLCPAGAGFYAPDGDPLARGL